MDTESSEPTFSLAERLRHLDILKFGSAVRPQARHDSEAPLSPGASTQGFAFRPRLSADATLTALAQLVALRMQCRYAFICLTDPKDQHILAVATRSISPLDAAVHAPGDALALGVGTMDRTQYGLSLVTLPAFTEGAEHWVNSDNCVADASKYLIADLQSDPRLTQRLWLPPDVKPRFFAEVPLKNNKRRVVGSVVVVDDAPSSSLAAIDVRPMEDVAQMVMDHFELVRLRDVNMRAERLIQGLAHFNAGQSSISQWIMDNPSQILPDDMENHDVQTRQKLSPSVEQGIDMNSQSPERDHKIVSELARQETGSSGHGVPNSPTETSPDGSMLVSKPSRPGLFDNSMALFRNNSQEAVRTERTSTTSENSSGDNSDRSEIVKRVFARASNIIRESMDLEATCFLEPAPDGASSTRRDFSAPKSAVPMSGKASNSEHSGSETSRSDTAASDPVNAQKEQSSDRELKYASRLGFSALLRSSVAGDSIARASMTLPEKDMTKLAAAFPHGHIFNFDAFGTLSSGDDSRPSVSRTSRHRRMSALVKKAFPAARSIVFMPLYDNETQKVYATFFGWTSSPYRVLIESEFVYIAGFANSVMCEVMRLEALTLEKAKSEFMSSMSHELRSPLHGILAATQLVQESDLTSSQRELAVMVDSCGRTLLDIIYNLLEHAKINNILPDKRLSKHKSIQSQTKGASTDEPDDSNTETQDIVDVADILEETVTAVAAGHSIKEQRIAQLAARKDIDLAQASHDNRSTDDMEDILKPPCVIIDIVFRDRWLFTTDAGSWRRIIMNLVGNALKYTDKGFVKIELRADDIGYSDKKTSQSQITLVVSDSGLGISEHYLKHRLFTPFQQENNLAVGVGLGLSIVNRLVKSMGGHIKLESKVRVGTTVTVTVPLKFPSQRPTLRRMASSETFASVRKLCSRGEKLCFVGFDISPNNDTKWTDNIELHASTLSQLKRSMIELVRSWFSLTITEDHKDATLFVVERTHALSLMKCDPNNDIFGSKYVVVTAYDNANIEKNQWTGRFYSLTVPIGPTKFARMLKTALQQESSPPPHPSEPPKPEPPRNSAASDGTNEVQQGDESSKLKEKDRYEGNGVTGTVEPQDTIQLDNSRRLLLVDDNNINLRILENLVKKLKLPYISAKDGQEALDKYIDSHKQGKPIYCVFMDISMPVMDGITSTKHIRAYERKSRVNPPSQIIALTGLGREETRRDAEMCGVDQYFTKPVKLDILRGILNKHADT